MEGNGGEDGAEECAEVAALEGDAFIQCCISVERVLGHERARNDLSLGIMDCGGGIFHDIFHLLYRIPYSD